MTGAAALTVVVAFFALDAAAEACEGKPVKRHKAEAFESIDRAYRHEMWREPSLVTNKLRNHWQDKKACLNTWGRKRVSRYRDNRYASREAWRAAMRERWDDLQFRRRYLPYGPCAGQYWAIPCYVVACESRYYWGAYNSSGAAGPYQIMPVHGRPWPVYSEEAKRAHHRIAYNLWHYGSPSNWMCA